MLSLIAFIRQFTIKGLLYFKTSFHSLYLTAILNLFIITHTSVVKILDSFLYFLRRYNILRFINLIVHDVCLMELQCEVIRRTYIMLRREHKVYAEVHAVRSYILSLFLSKPILFDLIDQFMRMFVAIFSFKI